MARALSLRLVLLVAVALGGSVGAPPAENAAEDVARWLGRLSAGGSVERLVAQRWLAVHLVRDDFADVAQFARAGAPEVRRRIAQALAADDRHLALAVLLLTDRTPAVEAVGREAVGEMLARWSTSTRAAPGRPRRFPEDWRERATRRIAVDRDGGALADVVDRLGRLGGGPAPLVLDPSLDPAVRLRLPARAAHEGKLVGTFAEVLTRLAFVHRVSFEVLGFLEESDPRSMGARPFLRVCKAGDEGEGTAERHIILWCEGVVREQSPDWNAACARALAATGWPAGIAWLERLWLASGDESALEGLLVAAARDRVAPALYRLEAIRALLATLDERLARGEPGSIPAAERRAWALARLAPTNASGEELVGPILAGWSAAPSAGRWLRLVVLEGMSASRADAERVAREALASTAEPVVRAQALRTLASIGSAGGAPVEVGAPLALFERANRLDLVEEFARALVDSRAAVPDGSWPGALPSIPAVQLALFEWALAAGARPVALGALDRLLAQQDALPDIARRLRRWAGMGRRAELLEFHRVARAGAQGAVRAARLLRLGAWAGLLAPEEEREVLDRLLAIESPSADELLDLGVFAASPTIGWRAREGLVAAVSAGAAEALLRPAIERAAAGLLAARLDEEWASLDARVRKAAVLSGHSLAQSLARHDWYVALEIDAEDLDVLDRRFLP